MQARRITESEKACEGVEVVAKGGCVVGRTVNRQAILQASSFNELYKTEVYLISNLCTRVFG